MQQFAAGAHPSQMMVGFNNIFGFESNNGTSTNTNGAVNQFSNNIGSD
jgi:hypothetical protein